MQLSRIRKVIGKSGKSVRKHIRKNIYIYIYIYTHTHTHEPEIKINDIALKVVKKAGK